MTPPPILLLLLLLRPARTDAASTSTPTTSISTATSIPDTSDTTSSTSTATFATDISITSTTATAGARGPLLANKCCPLGEELVLETPSSIVCAPVEGEAPAASGDPVEEETVAALLERHAGESPPWMLQNVTKSLGELPAGAYVRYGAPAPCAEADREVIPSAWRSRFRALASGTLRLGLGAWGGAGEARLAPEDFCADRVRAQAFPRLLVACPCRRALCVRKCCRGKQLFAERMVGGVGDCGAPTAEETAAAAAAGAGPGALRWKPAFHGADLQPVPPPAAFHLLAQPPQCAPDERLVLLNDGTQQTPRRMWVYENGSALLEHFGWGAPFAAGQWCGETLLLSDGQVVEGAVFCHEVGAPEAPSAGVQAYGALFLVGAIFLLLTLAVYWALPELRAPPHAKALMCHCAALLVASVTLACMQLSPIVPDELCEFGAMTIQFSFLAAFFWLNVLCIDISWAFSGLRGLLGSLLDTSRRKFLYYSIYGWGSPLIITAVTVGMHAAHKRKQLPPWVVVPNFGSKECWFYGEAAHWAYFYGPMAALLAANAALFVFTAARLAAAQCDAAQLNRGESVRHDRSSRLSGEKRRFILYTKLFVLMGVTWVLEVVSWSARQDKESNDVDPAWLLTDIINTLRGVFIFLIFCCKRKVLHMLRKRAGAWGLPVGLEDLSSTRSPTYRSATSTRQSSLLQLSPLSEAGLIARRASPAGLAQLPGANGAVKGPRRHSQPAAPGANGTAIKASRPKTQPPAPSANAPQLQTQLPVPSANGVAIKLPGPQTQLQELNAKTSHKFLGSETERTAPVSNGIAMNVLHLQIQHPDSRANGAAVKIPGSQTQPPTLSAKGEREPRPQTQRPDLSANGTAVGAREPQNHPSPPSTNAMAETTQDSTLQPQPPPS